MSDLKRSGRFGVLMALAVCVTALAAGLVAPAAQADRGLIGAFGEYGSGAGQFYEPSAIAVDPTDGNAIYLASWKEGNFAVTQLRKYDSAGNLLGTAEIPSPTASGVNRTVSTIAVDSSEQRVYVLIGGKRNDPAFSNAAATREILAFSTIPNSSGELTFAPGLPSGVLYDFRASGGFMYAYRGFAVDPSTHKLVVLGKPDAEVDDTFGLRYITDTGTLSTFVPDVSTNIAAVGPNTSRTGLQNIAVGPDGTVYLSTPYFDAVSSNASTVFSLQRESATATNMFTDRNYPISSESIQSTGALGHGNRLAVSPDGSTLFLAEQTDAEAPGRVRAYSVATKKGSYLYEGGSCGIPAPLSSFGVAAGSGGFLAAMGRAASAEPGQLTVHLFGEGAGATPCPSNAPTVPTIVVEGQSGSTISLVKGESRTLEVEAAGLRGFAATKVEWDLDGDDTYETQVTDGSLSINHKFAKAGPYQVGVKVVLENGEEPAPSLQSVEVTLPKPTASFKVSSKAPAANEAVIFDAGLSEDPAGSSSAEPTHELGTYKWSFGDGTSEETHTAKLTHAFANPGTAPLARTVKLTVVSKDGVESDPVQQTVTVAPVPPADTGGGGGGGGTTTPPVTTPTPPAPGPAPTGPKPLVCKKGFVKKKGKCAKKPAKHHHKKKHKKKK